VTQFGPFKVKVVHHLASQQGDG